MRRESSAAARGVCEGWQRTTPERPATQRLPTPFCRGVRRLRFAGRRRGCDEVRISKVPIPRETSFDAKSGFDVNSGCGRAAERVSIMRRCGLKSGGIATGNLGCAEGCARAVAGIPVFGICLDTVRSKSPRIGQNEAEMRERSKLRQRSALRMSFSRVLYLFIILCRRNWDISRQLAARQPKHVKL